MLRKRRAAGHGGIAGMRGRQVFERENLPAQVMSRASMELGQRAP